MGGSSEGYNTRCGMNGWWFCFPPSYLVNPFLMMSSSVCSLLLQATSSVAYILCELRGNRHVGYCEYWRGGKICQFEVWESEGCSRGKIREEGESSEV